MIKYSPLWLKKLASAHHCSAEEWELLDVDYGHFLGKACNTFIRKHGLVVDFISSHGHTVFHQPIKGFTSQLGNGVAIHATARLPVINDYRSLDVIRGGEGAPLVPIGDRLLFGDYEMCLNLGGIANLSKEDTGERIAYDICFCNMGLNYLMEKKGKLFDRGGNEAAQGKIHAQLLQQFQNAYRRWHKKRPSLGREFFEKEIKPLLDQKGISVPDKLATSVESTAIEIAQAIRTLKTGTVLCTGGGTFNAFLMSRILQHVGDQVSLIIPDDDVVKYKEALVFAFLGVLRVEKKVNCLRSVTGAAEDSSSGVMFGF